MGNNIIELNQFRNNKIYKYIVLLVVSHKERNIHYKGTHSFSSEIKPFPRNNFIEQLTDCLINGCHDLSLQHKVNPNDFFIEDFSVHFEEHEVTFYGKDLLPQLQNREEFLNFLSIHN